MSEASTPGGLTAALAEVMRTVERVEKDGFNRQQNYPYVTAEGLLRTVRGPMLQAGISVFPSVEHVEREPAGHTGNGVPLFHTTVKLRMLLVCGDEKHETYWVGTGLDTGDKGVYKAYTGALKTYLRSLLLLPQDQDDPERDEDLAPAPPVAELGEEAQQQLARANEVYQQLREAGHPWSAVEFGKRKTQARKGGDDAVAAFVAELESQLSKLSSGNAE